MDIWEKTCELLDERLQNATSRYIQKSVELFAQYGVAKTADDKNKILDQILALSKAHNALRENYEEAKEAILRDLDKLVTRYDEYFEAKLKNEPHEWD